MDNHTLSQPSKVIMKGFISACRQVGIDEEVQCRLLDISISSYHLQMEEGFHSDSPQYHRQLLLLSALRALFSFSGGDSQFMKHWIMAHNVALKGIPLQLMVLPDGLKKVEQYLVAMKNIT